MKTILEVFKAEPESNQWLIKELIAKGSKSNAAKNSLDRFVKELILPVVIELHPEMDNFKNHLLLGTMPDISMPLDWDTIFDRVSTKNKHFTLWKYFLDVTGLGTWIINFIFDLDLHNDMSKEESYRITYCLLMAAILSQST